MGIQPAIKSPFAEQSLFHHTCFMMPEGLALAPDVRLGPDTNKLHMLLKGD